MQRLIALHGNKAFECLCVQNTVECVYMWGSSSVLCYVGLLWVYVELVRIYVGPSCMFFGMCVFRAQHYVSMWECEYVSMWACEYVSMWACEYVSTWVCEYVSMSVCQYVRTSVCQYVSMSVGQYVSMSVGQYVSMSLCQYVSRWVCQYVNMSLWDLSPNCMRHIHPKRLHIHSTCFQCSACRVFLDVCICRAVWICWHGACQ